MNRLSAEKRAKIIHLICEGVSVRSISRLEDVSCEAVLKLLVDASDACKVFHNKTVRNVQIMDSVQCDELWSFVYCKDKTIEKDELVSPPHVHGTVWTWTALDTTSRLMLSCYISKDRDFYSAAELFTDLRKRIKTPTGRSQREKTIIYTDRLQAYRDALEMVFFGEARLVQDRKGPNRNNNTFAVERHNKTIRMCNRRYSRKTDAHSKLMRNQVASMNVFQTHYNFCRLHKSLQISPAMAAGISDTLYDETFIVDLIDKKFKPWRHGPKKGTQYGTKNPKITVQS